MESKSGDINIWIVEYHVKRYTAQAHKCYVNSRTKTR